MICFVVRPHAGEKANWSKPACTVAEFASTTKHAQSRCRSKRQTVRSPRRVCTTKRGGASAKRKDWLYRRRRFDLAEITPCPVLTNHGHFKGVTVSNVSLHIHSESGMIVGKDGQVTTEQISAVLDSLTSNPNERATPYTSPVIAHVFEHLNYEYE